MIYDGRAVANFILDFCEQQDRSVTHLALQKITYFCHVWSLIELQRPLIKHSFEAWEHGPVLPYLYREFKLFERSPITTRATRIDPTSGKNIVVEYAFDDKTLALLQRITAFYSRMSASDLRNISHVTGGPWHEVWFHQGCANPGMKIDNDRIAAFYSRAARPFSVQ